MSIEEIVANIDARIAALQSDIQPLLDAKDALVNSSGAPSSTNRVKCAAQTPAGAQAGSARMRKPRRAVARAKLDPVPSGKLISLLEGSDGLTTAALVEETGGDASQIRCCSRSWPTLGRSAGRGSDGPPAGISSARRNRSPFVLRRSKLRARPREG